MTPEIGKMFKKIESLVHIWPVEGAACKNKGSTTDLKSPPSLCST